MTRHVKRIPVNERSHTTTTIIFCALAIAFSGLLLMRCGKTTSAKFKQYYVHGEQLYTKHCSNCHQPDGSGLGRVYPPLDTSDYMEKNFSDVLCLMRHGKTGEVIVNGESFNQAMPGVSSLTDLEIAEIATYIYNTWSHDRGIVEVKDVSRIVATCQQ